MPISGWFRRHRPACLNACCYRPALTIVFRSLISLPLFPTLDLSRRAARTLLAPDRCAGGVPDVPVEMRVPQLERLGEDGICVRSWSSCSTLRSAPKLSTDRWDTLSPLSSRRSHRPHNRPRADRHSRGHPSDRAQREWISATLAAGPVVALAAPLFSRSGKALGGSGFIACFVGGLLFSYLHDRPKKCWAAPQHR